MSEYELPDEIRRQNTTRALINCGSFEKLQDKVSELVQQLTDLEAENEQLKASSTKAMPEDLNDFRSYCFSKYDEMFKLAENGEVRHSIISQKSIVNNLVSEYQAIRQSIED